MWHTKNILNLQFGVGTCNSGKMWHNYFFETLNLGSALSGLSGVLSIQPGFGIPCCKIKCYFLNISYKYFKYCKTKSKCSGSFAFCFANPNLQRHKNSTFNTLYTVGTQDFWTCNIIDAFIWYIENFWKIVTLWYIWQQCLNLKVEPLRRCSRPLLHFCTISGRGYMKVVENAMHSNLLVSDSVQILYK